MLRTPNTHERMIMHYKLLCFLCAAATTLSLTGCSSPVSQIVSPKSQERSATSKTNDKELDSDSTDISSKEEAAAPNEDEDALERESKNGGVPVDSADADTDDSSGTVQAAAKANGTSMKKATKTKAAKTKAAKTKAAKAKIETKAETVTADTGLGRTISYPYIDPAGLDNTAIGWGMGPTRDEFNRPVTALQYQEEYKDFHVDFIIPTEEKVLYLTFDEGYENGFSGRILDTLKVHNAQGVFFVTKPYAESSPDLVKRMIDEGHVIGNHTVHHPSDGMQAHDIDYQTNEVRELHDYIKNHFGYEMCLFRYPTGMFSRQSLAVISNCGYRSSFWSFAYADWDRNNQPNPQEALQKLESSLHPGAIYLLHAVSETNTNILDEFLTYAESQGYTIGHYLDTLH